MWMDGWMDGMQVVRGLQYLNFIIMGNRYSSNVQPQSPGWMHCSANRSDLREIS